jgi:hypothetical protein
MKQRIKEAMLLFDTPKIQINGGVGGTLSFRKSEQLVITDEDYIVSDYKKIEVSVDKAKLKDAIKRGYNCPGAHIEENMNLQIK